LILILKKINCISFWTLFYKQRPFCELRLECCLLKNRLLIFSTEKPLNCENWTYGNLYLYFIFKHLHL